MFRYNINKLMFFPFLSLPLDQYYYPTYTPAAKQQPSQPPQQPFVPFLKAQQQNEEQIDSSPKGLSVGIEELKKAGYKVRKQVWTPEEDNLLLDLVDKKMRWAQIAAQMPGRTTKMCYSRHIRLLKRKDNGATANGVWTKEEEKQLIELVDIHGQAWKELAVYFQNRKPKQLREHYINALTPNLTKQAWTLEEDLILIDWYNKIGKKWKAIASHLKRRSENQVKNRFYGRLQQLDRRSKEKQ